MASIAQITEPRVQVGPPARAAAFAKRALPTSLLLIIQRLGVAAVFFQSGRTKVEGWFTIPDTTIELFRSEYALPLVQRNP